MIKPADTITLLTGAGIEHLYFIIGEYDNSFLLVNATTYHPDKDQSCILTPTDHIFIKHKSLINYGDAITTTEFRVEKNIRNGLSRQLAPITRSVLCRIQKGALISPALMPKYRRYMPHR